MPSLTGAQKIRWSILTVTVEHKPNENCEAPNYTVLKDSTCWFITTIGISWAQNKEVNSNKNKVKLFQPVSIPNLPLTLHNRPKWLRPARMGGHHAHMGRAQAPLTHHGVPMEDLEQKQVGTVLRYPGSVLLLSGSCIHPLLSYFLMQPDYAQWQHGMATLTIKSPVFSGCTSITLCMEKAALHPTRMSKAESHVNAIWTQCHCITADSLRRK